MRGEVGIGGAFTLEYVRQDGTLGWRVEIPNAWTIPGLNYLLELCFRGEDSTATQTSIWAAGFIDDLGFVGVSPGDFLSSHPGWVEFRQLYQSRPGVASRAFQLWSPALDGSINSEQPAVLTVTSGATTFTVPNSSGTVNVVSDGTIRGTFLCNGQFVGSGTVLICTAVIPASQDGLAVERGGRLRVSYNLHARELLAAAAPALDGDVMVYGTYAEMVGGTGGDLVTSGDERAGTIYYRTTVSAAQRLGESIAATTFVYYSGVTSSTSTLTIYDRMMLTTTVGVAQRKTTLIDGRPDLIATGMYRR